MHHTTFGAGGAAHVEPQIRVRVRAVRDMRAVRPAAQRLPDCVIVVAGVACGYTWEYNMTTVIRKAGATAEVGGEDGMSSRVGVCVRACWHVQH